MTFNWEITKSDRHMPWKTLLFIGLISLSSAAYFFVIKRYVAFALFIIAHIVMILTSMQGPDKTTGSVSSNGILINDKNYNYDSLEYFSIVRDYLILKPKEEKAQYFAIHEHDSDDLREVLSGYIPEKEHDENLIDIINRYLRIH